MQKGMKLNLAAQWMHASCNSDAMAFGASVDSRLTKKGDLFFACPGNRCDGHEFLKEVFMKGAVAAVVSHDYQGDDFGLSLIRVDNSQLALQLLAKHYLTSLPTKVVAITGSAGKTTTKGFLAQLLSLKYRIAATPGNYNSQLGLPLTLLNHLSGDEEYIVLEMGMTQAGHIASLVQIAPPLLAILTGVSLAHAENFASLEEIGMAKAEIFSHPQTKLGILDRQIVNYQAITHSAKHCEYISFGLDALQEVDYSLRVNEQAMSIFKKKMQVATFNLLPIPGLHNRQNFLAAAIAAHHCGMEWEEMQPAIALLSLPPMRLQHVLKQGILFINDAYNALPIAVKGALDSLPTPKQGGRKIAVLGEMRELGCFSEACHQEIAEYALDCVDILFCLGAKCASIHALWTSLGRSAYLFTDLLELETYFKTIVQQNDVVLIKGSRISGLSALPEKF